MAEDPEPQGAVRLLAAYGALGLLPFYAPLAAIALPALAPWAAMVQLGYGAVILSFLGGVRLGRVLQRRDALAVSAAMGPSILGLAVLATPPAWASLRYDLLILGFVAQWLWDRRAFDLPSGYRTLRLPLTAFAVLALVLGDLLLARGFGA